MKKFKKQKPLLPKAGILVITTRSGFIKAAYFDPDNDFPYLNDVLRSAYLNHYRDLGCNIPDNVVDDSDIYNHLQKFCGEHDCGSFEIVENEITKG